MARPRSEDKRRAILKAATEAVAALGVGAPTATIAKKANVAEGTLFTYFASKDDLLNDLYLELKTDLADAMLRGYPGAASLAERSFHAWGRYIDWGADHPVKRRAMRQLAVSERITDCSRSSGNAAFRDIEAIIDESLAAAGKDQETKAFVAAVMESLAETTLEFVAREPGRREHYKRAGYEMFCNAAVGA